MNFSIITESWFSLAIAIAFGVVGTLLMKLSHGLQYPKPAFGSIFFYAISFTALTFAIKHIDLSIVYAVWSGVGTVLVATIGVLYFKESISLKKIFFLFLIVLGVIGIHLNNAVS